MIPPPLMGVGEIARRLGVDRRRAATISRRKGFPAPVAKLSLGRVWLVSHVEAWAVEQWDPEARR